MNIEVMRGDITALRIDAIVNAANTRLVGGGGVDGAIHRKAGPSLVEECQVIRNRQGGCRVGQAVATSGGLLPVRHIIHTVGPTWVGGGHNEETLLAECYTNSLLVAEELGATSVAFPNISTGVYGFPKELAAPIAIAAVQDFLAHRVQRVLFVCFDQENHRLYRQALG